MKIYRVIVQEKNAKIDLVIVVWGQDNLIRVRFEDPQVYSGDRQCLEVREVLDATVKVSSESKG